MDNEAVCIAAERWDQRCECRTYRTRSRDWGRSEPWEVRYITKVTVAIAAPAVLLAVTV